MRLPHLRHLRKRLAAWLFSPTEFNTPDPARLLAELGRVPLWNPDPAEAASLTGQTVLVTGAAGSIGSELVRQLLRQQPTRLVLLDQAESGLFTLDLALRRQGLPTEIRIEIADITDETRLTALFRQYRPDQVFHAAAYKHVPLMEDHPYEALRVNVLGTRLLARLALAYGTRVFLLISTDKAVRPTTVMGATKRLAELYLRQLADDHPLATRFVISRFGNVLGSSGSVLPVFAEQIRRGGPVTVTHPEVTRYFMTIPEACGLVREAARLGRGGEIYTFDMGQPVRIADLAQALIRQSGRRIPIRYTGLRPGEKLHEELMSPDEQPLPTPHPRIWVSYPGQSLAPAPDLEALLRHLPELLAASRPGELVRWLEKIVPDYQPANPRYVHHLPERSVPITQPV